MDSISATSLKAQTFQGRGGRVDECVLSKGALFAVRAVLKRSTLSSMGNLAKRLLSNGFESEEPARSMQFCLVISEEDGFPGNWLRCVRPSVSTN
jgi:hypothetical protein